MCCGEKLEMRKGGIRRGEGRNEKLEGEIPYRERTENILRVYINKVRKNRNKTIL